MSVFVSASKSIVWKRSQTHLRYTEALNDTVTEYPHSPSSHRRSSNVSSSVYQQQQSYNQKQSLTQSHISDLNKMFRVHSSTLSSTKRPQRLSDQFQELADIGKQFSDAQLGSDSASGLERKDTMTTATDLAVVREVDDESGSYNMEDEQEELGRCADFQQHLNLALPHIVLTAVMLVYLVSGALILMLLESGAEIESQLTKMTALKIKYEEIVNETFTILKSTDMDEMEWGAMMTERLLILAEIHEGMDIREQFFDYSKVPTKWTFPTALLNTLTLLAACGYNEVTCYTGDGQMFAVAYTMCGIPLMFVTAANIGKVLSEVVVFVMDWSKRFYVQITRCHRRVGRHVRMKRQERALKQQQNNREKGLTTPEEDNQPTSTEDTEDMDYVDIPEQPQNIWFAVMVYVSGISAYCCLGTFMFRAWRPEWSFMHAFHFGFNLIVTVGLGNIVVVDPVFLCLVVAFCIVGLAVVTMCIDLASEHLKEYFMRIHYYGRRHKLTLDEDIIHMVQFLTWLRQKKGGQVTWKEVRDLFESIHRGAYNPRQAVRWHWMDYDSSTIVYTTRLSANLREQRQPACPHESPPSQDYDRKRNSMFSTGKLDEEEEHRLDSDNCSDPSTSDSSSAA